MKKVTETKNEETKKEQNEIKTEICNIGSSMRKEEYLVEEMLKLNIKILEITKEKKES